MDVRNTKWILLMLIGCICTSNGQADWDWDVDSSSLGDFPMRTEMACEDYPIVIRCPGHDVIQIASAVYGRQNTYKCSASASEMENTNCALPEAKDIVMKKCNNKTHCTFLVSRENFPDPCPGTRKYLETKFNCVRYMFACPGMLTGIGAEISTTIDVRPQPGTWTKDALFNTDHVFFAPSGNKLQEFSNWDKFANGITLTTYSLPSTPASGNIVVHDRNLYYIRQNTRTIIRYNLMTRTQIQELTIPSPPGSGNGRYSNKLSLAVDEQGLWVVYTRGKGMMSFSKLDSYGLAISKTWTTNRRMSESAHTFFICGVLYSVSTSTGRVDYSYNTNLKEHQEKRGLNIQFDATNMQSRKRTTRRSFSQYRTSPISYNPRDQLLYTWDATDGNAVYYKLHFDGKDPSVDAPTTTSTTTTTTQRSTTTTTLRPEIVTTENVPKTPSENPPPEAYRPIDYCHQTLRNGLNWPTTRVGRVAKLGCPDGHGDFATWRCVREASMAEAAWHVAGPDLSKCITWASNIGAKYKSGLIERSSAFESIAVEVSNENQMNEKAIQVTIDLIEKLFEDATPPSQENAKKIAQSMTVVSDSILGNEKVMTSLSPEKQVNVSIALMNSTEKAGFMYAKTVAMSPAESREQDPLVLPSDEVLMVVDVRERYKSGMMSSSMTSFPNEKTCQGNEDCGSNSIQIPELEIQAQGVEGPVIVVYSLYNNVGRYLSLPGEPDWTVDARVISATLQHQDYATELNTPAVIALQHKNASASPRRCVYWNNVGNKGAGNWSENGCRLTSSNLTHTVCECDHLTSFTVLVNHQGLKMEPHQAKAMSIVTKVGISISIVCLFLSVLTFSCFKNLHSDRNTIHKHLCICLLLAELLFLVGIDQTSNEIACSAVAGILHYFFLAAFLWMALEGFQLYVLLVEVFESESRWKWYYAIGYGVPAVIVGISAAVDPEGYGTEEVCWLRFDTGFIWSFAGPVLLIILVNLGFLSMTVYKMYVSTLTFTDSGKINAIKASLRGASVLLCLLGITWAFGILWITEEMAVVAYLFCIFNAFQGLFIFVFYCLLPRKVRQEYKRCLSRLPCCSKFSRDSYVANSSSFSKQYTPGRYPVNSSNGTSHQPTMGQSQLRRMWNETVAPRNSDSPMNSERSLNGVQNRDSIRANTQPSRSTVARHYPDSSRNYLHEDEVFLPPEGLRRTAELANHTPVDERQYDHLQHHHHPDDYLDFEQPEARPMGHFNTGQTPQNRFPHRNHRDQKTPLMGTHQHFGPRSVSQSKLQEDRLGNREDVLYEPSNGDFREPNRHQMNRRSLDEIPKNGKRDSGISLQRPSPNSGSEYPNSQRRSLDNTAQIFSERNGRFKRNSLENTDRQKYYHDRDPVIPAHCPLHNPTIVPLRDNQSRSQAPGNRRRKSLSSDSDDPIVTDCSVSSAGSSSGHHLGSSRPPTDASYYEEPICRKRMLPNPAHVHQKHREQYHRDNTDTRRDENDLEVEMITNSDNSLERDNAGTLGYPPYRPPTPPDVSKNAKVTTTSMDTPHSMSGLSVMQRNEIYTPHGERQPPKKSHRHSKRHSNEFEIEPTRRQHTGL